MARHRMCSSLNILTFETTSYSLKDFNFKLKNFVYLNLWTFMKCHIMWHLIKVFTVCQNTHLGTIKG